MDDMNQTLPSKPSNHMVMAIVTTVLSVITCAFSWVIPIAAGITSIVFATQVNSKYNNGDYDGAEKASNYAKISWIVGIVVIIGFIIYVATTIGSSWEEISDIFNQEMEKQQQLQN